MSEIFTLFLHNLFQVHVRIKKLKGSNGKDGHNMQSSATSSSADPYIATVCGMFARDRTDVVLIDYCKHSMLKENIRPSLFMASLGANNKYVTKEPKYNNSNKIKMSEWRDGTVVVVDFAQRQQSIRIDFDNDKKALSIHIQARL